MEDSDDASDEISIEPPGEDNHAESMDTTETELDQWLEEHEMPADDDADRVDYTTKIHIGIRLQHDVESAQLLIDKFAGSDLKETKPVLAAQVAARIVHKRARLKLISAIQKHAERRKKRMRDDQPKTSAAMLKAAKAHLSKNALKVLNSYTDSRGAKCCIAVAKALQGHTTSRPSPSNLDAVAKAALTSYLRKELADLTANENGTGADATVAVA